MQKNMEKILAIVEKVSLVRLSNKETSLRLLDHSIEAARPLSSLKGSDVKPLISLCNEDPWRRKGSDRSKVDSLHLRPDRVIHPNKQDILCNASLLIEGYFVTPNNTTVIATSTSDDLEKADVKKKE